MEDGPPIFRQDFSCPALLVSTLVPHVCFRIQGYHLLWPDFPFRFANSRAINRRLFRFRSPLLSESRLMSFPRATEMFQFTRFASHDYVFIMRYLLRGGFPHSDISGSLDMCSSPKLFAAYHVFHRLLVPRHPPCALTTLTVAGTIESLDSLFPH